jgi:hypothetical protein
MVIKGARPGVPAKVERTTTLQWVKSTKGTHVYDGGTVFAGNTYFSKDFLPDPHPETIEVTVKF